MCMHEAKSDRPERRNKKSVIGIYNMNESLKYYAKWKKPDSNVTFLWFHLFDVLEKEK